MNGISAFLMVASLHLQGGAINPEHFNQFNPGAGIEYGDWCVGSYRNSLKHQTEFAAWHPYKEFTPFVGVFTGYEYGHPMPNAGVMYRHTSGATLTVMPYNTHGGFVAAVAWRF